MVESVRVLALMTVQTSPMLDTSAGDVLLPLARYSHTLLSGCSNIPLTLEISLT